MVAYVWQQKQSNHLGLNPANGISPSISSFEKVLSDSNKEDKEMKTGKEIFCGGTFCFDYREDGYEVMAAKDYRTEMLGSVDALLYPKGNNGVKISDGIIYVGPYYFEAESMEDVDIIRCEKEMIESCSDAIFLFDNVACPGTITEMMYANSLGKTLHLFYVKHKENEETESELHTPCWYPIQFCKMTNKYVNIYPCSSVEDGANKILSFIESLMK